MRDAVKAVFNSFTEKYEGHTSWMYLDILGLVTTGRGNLIDPMGAALGLPWQHKDGTPATQADIVAEWHRIKALQSMRNRGGYAYRPYASLHLTTEAVDALCLNKVQQFEHYLRQRFPHYDSWCADAQLGLVSMAWAMGPGFRFPAFVEAANGGSWELCAGHPGNPNVDPMARGFAWINDDHNPGVRPRNIANKQLFHNAADVEAYGADPSVLYYPGTVPAPEPVEAVEAAA